MKDKCSKYREKLSAYMDGRLSPDEMARVARHLETCESCAVLLERMRRVDGLAENVLPEFDEALMVTLSDRIARGLDQSSEPGEDRESARPRVIPVWYRYAAVAASVIIVFLAGRMALKESGGDLLKPSSQIEMLKRSPSDTMLLDSEAQSAPAGKGSSVGEGVDERRKEQPSEPAAAEPKGGSKKGAGVEQEPVSSEEEVARQLSVETARVPVEEVAEKAEAADMAPESLSGRADRPDAETPAEIRGKVIDAATGRPLPDVSVQVKGTTRGARSSTEGEFVIEGVPRDTYDLVYSSPGYLTTQIEIPVDTGQAIAQTIPMERAVLEAGRITEVAARKYADTDVSDSALARGIESDDMMALPGIDSLEALYAALINPPANAIEDKGRESKALSAAYLKEADSKSRAKRLLDSLENTEIPTNSADYLALRFLRARAAIDIAGDGGEQEEANRAAFHLQMFEETLQELVERGYDSKGLDVYRRAIVSQREE